MIKMHFIYRSHEIPMYYCGKLGNMSNLSLDNIDLPCRDPKVSQCYKKYYGRYSLNQICLFYDAYQELVFDSEKLKDSVFVTKPTMKIISDNLRGIYDNHNEIFDVVLSSARPLDGESYDDFIDRAFDVYLDFVNKKRKLFGNFGNGWD